ncbi:MAG: hypothetical protein HQM00_00050 [Magnetococcales bacterium]|nr:hypothetical protein [Magnetococcales bacterium]
MKKLLFFCRYALKDQSAGSLFESSIAAKRKIDGICDAFLLTGLRPVLFATPLAPVGRFYAPTRIVRSESRIVVIPGAVNLFNHRALSYVVNVLWAAILAAFLVMRKPFRATLVYNMMPDTLIPSILARLTGGDARHLIDLEEEISADTEAPALFRSFDRLTRRHLRFDGALVAASALKRSIRAPHAVVFHGFAPVEEIESTRERCATPRAPQQPGWVAFIGRIDEMRCVSEFLSAVEGLAAEGVHFRVTVIGYCDDPGLMETLANQVKRLQQSMPVALHFSASRQTILDTLNQCDICVSLVKENRFLESSFPSKLIEFLLYDRLIISQRVEDLQALDNFVWIPSAEVEAIRAGIVEALSRRMEPSVRHGREWVLNHCTVHAGAQALEGLFAAMNGRESRP